MRRRNLLVLLLGVVLVVGLVGVAVWTSRDTYEPPAATGEPAPDGLEEFYGQDLQLEECGDARCATVVVPIDYAEPDGDTTELRLAVHSATGGGGKAVFVNPGGPGGSAISFAETMAGIFPDSVRETYDVVGVDPRGVGESTPIDCVDGPDFDAYVAGDPDPDTDAEVAELREATTAFGEGCLEKSGDLAAHVSTEEAARDMDVVRALLGQEQMDWFGASYGTQLGATYASLFPEKVGRMVLDGAVDPAQGVVESSLGQATGFQRAIRAYAEACVQLESCPLGDDADEAVQQVRDLLDRLDEQPLPTGTDRELTEGLAFYGIAVTLYDKATWVVLSQALTVALQGDGQVLLRLSDAYFQRQPDGSFDGNIGEVITVISCLDARERLTLEETEGVLDRFEQASPVFGRALGWGTLACTDWPIEAENPQIEIDATGAPPIIVLGTTRDPATPYENSQALADQLGPDVGVLVTREGDGHTAYTSGNTCITEAIDTFYVDGTVPEDDLTCPDE